MKTVEDLNKMTSEEFRSYLNHTKEGRHMVQHIAKNYSEIKNKKQLEKKTQNKTKFEKR